MLLRRISFTINQSVRRVVEAMAIPQEGNYPFLCEMREIVKTKGAVSILIEEGERGREDGF